MEAGQEIILDLVDIAIDIDLADYNDRSDHWIHYKRIWAKELQIFIPYDIDLDLNDGEYTPTIKDSLKRLSILVYSK